MFGHRRNGFGSVGGDRKYGGGGGDRSRGGQRGGVVFNFYGGGPPRGGGGAGRGGGYGYGGPPQPYCITPGLPPMGYGATRSLNDAGAKLRPIEWDRIQLPPITKNLYREHATIARRAQTEVDQWLTESECTLEGSDIPRPICEFVESGFPQPIIDLLYTHYQRPTVIQAISWPVALSGRDQISIAKTGSGKTLGFILPAIVRTLSQPKRRSGEGPSVLVLLPTRELAIQVEEVAREYCNLMRLELTCCYGGAPKTNQANDLRKGVDICVATPGRILDFLEGNKTNMRRCTFLVLDEADRMLDMGFEPQIRKIVGQIRPDRQTLMFSATWPREVRALAADFQQNPVHLHVGSLELAANHNIQQHVEIIEEHAKQGRLLQLLDNIMRQRECKTLVFVQTKRKADDLTRDMRRDGWPALCIHGDKEQKEREWVLSEFKDGKMPILFATDVAARGLDVSDIKFVINYDYPNNSEDYVHRIGRTGRQDKTGTSYTFFSPLSNAPKAADLIKVLEEAKQVVPEGLRECALNSIGNNKDKGKGRRWRPVQPDGDGGPSATKRVKPNNDDGGGFGSDSVGFSIGGPSNSNSWGNNNNDSVTNGFSNSNAAYFW